MASTALKLNFAVADRFGAFYTGGCVQTTSDGEHLLCACGSKIQILSIKTGKVIHSLEKDEDEVTSFVLSPDDQLLVTAGKSLILRQWHWQNEEVTRSWKAIHTGPVTCMKFDCTSTLLATGGSDSTIKVWDVIKQYCTHNLRGHQGVVTSVEYHPDISRLQLFTAAEDYKIRLWDLQTSSCTAVLDIHFSVITSMQLSPDGDTLYSGGRDNVVSVFDLKAMKKVKTIPVYESVESLWLMPLGKNLPQINVEGDSDQFFITAGSKGVLRVWNSQTAQCVYTQESSTSEQTVETPSGGIVRMMYCKSLNKVITVTFDHNIIMYNMDDFTLHKQFVGYNDEILDVKYIGEEDSHIAVATNSEYIRVYDLATWDCQILRGHSDIVLGLDVYKKLGLLVSCSKDNCIRLWQMNPDTKKLSCVGVGKGHTHAVAAVAFSRLQSSFVVSGSEDLTIKAWPLPPFTQDNQTERTLVASATEKAHDKDINSICVSPNDKLIATGSQDRTAKMWDAKSLSLLGVMRGHKRGIWCVQFSPVDQCLASSSADGSIRIWALSDFSCVRTFEGHDCSVLKVCFLTRGMQLLSSGSDGLLKLWTIKSNECVKTFDEHEGKAWALVVNGNEETIVTGAEDSTILIWKDRTEADENESRQKQVEIILQEQQLSNLLQQKKYLKAIGLAITLDQPFRVLSVLKEILSAKGKQSLEDTLKKLRLDQLDSLLRFAVTWNMNSKHCHEAQFVLSVILRNFSPQELMEFPNIKSSVEGLLPYTDRHFSRMNRLMQQSTFVDYTWQCMRVVGFEGDQPVDRADTENADLDETSQHKDTPTETGDLSTKHDDITTKNDDVIESDRENDSSVKEAISPSDKENNLTKKRKNSKTGSSKKKKSNQEDSITPSKKQKKMFSKNESGLTTTSKAARKVKRK